MEDVGYPPGWKGEYSEKKIEEPLDNSCSRTSFADGDL